MTNNQPVVVSVSGTDLILRNLGIEPNKLSAKELAQKTAERLFETQELEREQKRKGKIHKNICPDCEGKLSRGKKDKNNDYKRAWHCNLCVKSHYA